MFASLNNYTGIINLVRVACTLAHKAYTEWQERKSESNPTSEENIVEQETVPENSMPPEVEELIASLDGTEKELEALIQAKAQRRTRRERNRKAKAEYLGRKRGYNNLEDF